MNRPRPANIMKPTHSTPDQTTTLRKIAEAVEITPIYQISEEDQETLNITVDDLTPSQILAQGHDPAAPHQWTIVKLDAPDEIKPESVHIQYETWGADSQGIIVNGIGDLSTSATGIDKQKARRELQRLAAKHIHPYLVSSTVQTTLDEIEKIATQPKEKNIDTRATDRTKIDDSTLQTMIQLIDDTQKRRAKEIFRQHISEDTPLNCDYSSIWISPTDRWAGWTKTLNRLEQLVPRSDDNVREDLKSAIQTATQAKIDVQTSDIATANYQLEYELDPHPVFYDDL